MLKILVFYCCLAQLNIFITGTESGSETLPDTTPTTTVFTTSTIISTETTSPTTTPFQCVYDGKVYNVGDTFIANNNCDICWCLSSQLICTMCPPQPSTSTTSSTISSEPTTTTTSATSTTTSPETATTTASTTSSTISSEPTTTTTSATSTTTSPETATTTAPDKCVYKGQVYNDGDTFIDNNYCQSYCWCMGSQIICSICPSQTSTSTTSSTISSEPTTTTTSATSTTTSPETATTTAPDKCVYKGQVYNDGDTFIDNNYCQSYCWCMGSQIICSICPSQTSTSTTSSTISSEPTTTTTSATSTTTSPETATTTAPDKCVYKGQVYNDGDTFIDNNYCQSYCWCMGSQIICSICPSQTSTSTTSTTISSEPTTTTTATSVSSRLPIRTSSSTYTERKRRRPTLTPALYTNTKKLHTGLFNDITKKPHFTIPDSHELGSKSSTRPKGNRRNVDI